MRHGSSPLIGRSHSAGHERFDQPAVTAWSHPPRAPARPISRGVFSFVGGVKTLAHAKTVIGEVCGVVNALDRSELSESGMVDHPANARGQKPACSLEKVSRVTA